MDARVIDFFLPLAALAAYILGLGMTAVNCYLWKTRRQLCFYEETIIVTFFIGCLLVCASIVHITVRIA